jgi:hypothetical protein
MAYINKNRYILLIAILMTVGCANKSSPSKTPEELIIGKWESYKSIRYDGHDISNSITPYKWEFKQNEFINYYSQGHLDQGTYQITDSILYINGGKYILDNFSKNEFVVISIDHVLGRPTSGSLKHYFKKTEKFSFE